MTPRRVEVRDGDNLVFVPTGVSRPLDLGPILIKGTEMGLNHRSSYVTYKIQLCSMVPSPRTRFDDTFRVFEIESEERPSPATIDRIDRLNGTVNQMRRENTDLLNRLAVAERKLAKIKESL